MKQTKVFIVLCGLTLILLVGLAVLRKAEIMNMTNVKYTNILTFLHIWTPLIGILFVAAGAIFITKTVKKT